MSGQPEALRLAEWLKSVADFGVPSPQDSKTRKCAAELLRQHALIEEMLKALQRLTHPAADDEDLAYALEVIAKATGGVV